MIDAVKKPARKLTPLSKAKAHEARVAKLFTATFDRVVTDLWALPHIMIAGKKARDEGGDDDAIVAAMVLAFRRWVPTPVPSIPRADLAVLGTDPEAMRVGEPDETALAFAARAGLRVLVHDHIGRAVVSGAAGERLVLGRDPESRKLYVMQNGLIEGRVL